MNVLKFPPSPWRLSSAESRSARQGQPAPDSGGVAEGGYFDAHVIGGEHADPLSHRRTDGLEEEVAETRQSTAQDDSVGVQHGDDVRDADAEVARGFDEHLAHRF